jgi:CspA family cold shock protein
MATGIVKWFNYASGYGYIVPDEGDKEVFVRRASFIGDWPAATLTEGARVEFERQEGGMGTEAMNVVGGAGREAS